MRLQGSLYPTVGLQTPGEVVEANFGQLPFAFDIEDYMKVSKLCVCACVHACVQANWCMFDPSAMWPFIATTVNGVIEGESLVIQQL